VRWPDFFIVGAAKAGTTSLYAYMRQHPEVFMPDLKEPHFFSGVRATDDQSVYVQSIADEDEYLRLFLPGKDYKRIGEASPSYLWHPEAAARIHAANPNARIIILLRDPIERAYSHYLMDVRRGRQTLPFLEAVRKDYDSPEKGWGVSHLYVELGLYEEQVARYINLFGEEQVLVLPFDDLKRDPIGTTHRALNFIGVDPALANWPKNLRAHNPAATPRGKIAASLLQSRRLHEISRRIVPLKMRKFVNERLLLRRSNKPTISPTAVAFLKKVYESSTK